MWMAVIIEPGALGEAATFDDQGVAVPASHRASHPTRIRILGQLAAVHVNLTIREVFEKDHDDRARLDELDGVRRREGRRTKRQALAFHALRAEISQSTLIQRLRPRLDVRGLQICARVVIVVIGLSLPHSG